MKRSIKKSINLFGLPIISLRINGRLYSFIVDTGSTANYIVESTFKTIAEVASLIGDTSTSGFDGIYFDQNVAMIPSSLDGKFRLEGFGIISSNPFNDICCKDRKANIVGIVGLPFLILNRARIDYDKGLIEYKTPPKDKTICWWNSGNAKESQQQGQ